MNVDTNSITGRRLTLASSCDMKHFSFYLCEKRGSEFSTYRNLKSHLQCHHASVMTSGALC